MRVLVYPHAMEIGGSQLNAVELAVALKGRGHEVVVYSEPGPLVARVEAHAIEHIPKRESRLRPGVATTLDLRRVIRDRSIDVVHAWEWPPILESYAAASPGSHASVVGSIMSMGVAGFLPRRIPLTLGTQALVERVAADRTGPTVLLEPPVDLEENRPGASMAAFDEAYPRPTDTQQVVIVSRLAHELKLEGILTAIAAVARLAPDRPLRLVIVGDGPARQLVDAAAQEANAQAGREIVLLTGELEDPRGAYDAADICVAMGGSALRALAFSKPLIVQGEGGFFELCSADTADQFLDEGWYGIAARGREEAVGRLEKLLDHLLADRAWRASLGEFGRALVSRRYGIESGASALEAMYQDSIARPPTRAAWLAGGLALAPSLASYKVRRRWQRLRGTRHTDDFNARRG